MAKTGWYEIIKTNILDEIVTLLRDSTRTTLAAVKNYNIKVGIRDAKNLLEKGKFPYVFVMPARDIWNHEDVSRQFHVVSVEIVAMLKHTSDPEKGLDNAMLLYGDIYDELMANLELSDKIDFIREGETEIEYAFGSNFVLHWITGRFDCVTRK